MSLWLYGLLAECTLITAPLPAQAAAPGEALAAGIAWGGKEGTQDRQARSQGSLTDAAMSVWKRASSRLFDLEAKIVTQVSLGENPSVMLGLPRNCCPVCVRSAPSLDAAS